MDKRQRYRPSIDVYAQWINQQNSRAAREWCLRIDSDDNARVEGAIAEAVAFDYLGCHEVDRVLADVPGLGGPDFRCSVDGHEFFVEITNIAEGTAERHTGLHDDQKGFRYYAPLTDAIFSKVTNKARQFSGSNIELPLVVFVVTLHFSSSHICVSKPHLESLLIGTPHIEGDYDSQVGGVVGGLRQATKLTDSIFIKQSLLTGLETVRHNISAAVVGGFGASPPTPPVYGLLHPQPTKTFNTNALPSVVFGRVHPWPPSPTLSVEWSDEAPLGDTTVREGPRLILPGEAGYF